MNQDETTDMIYYSPKRSILETNRDLIESVKGFAIGLCFNVFGFFVLGLMRNKTKKRRGVVVGCIFSLILILFVSVSFLSYLSYAHKLSNYNKKIKRKDRRLGLRSYSFFMKSNIGGFLGDPMLFVGSGTANNNRKKEKQVKDGSGKKHLV